MDWKNTIKNFLIRAIIGQLTIEKLKVNLSSLLWFLDGKASETENVVDDWIIEALYDIVNNDEKLKVVYNFVMNYIQPGSDGVCKALPGEEQWKQLAVEVTSAGEPEGVCKSVDIAQIVRLLQMVIPAIIEIYEQVKKK